MECAYVEFVTGSITHRNNIVPIGQARLNGERRECYRSLFRFDAGFAAFVARTGSTAGYQGPHTSECLLFDFDGEDDLEAVREGVLTFIEATAVNFDIPPEYWQLSFSGAKGFHASLPLRVLGDVQASEHLVDTYRAVCCELAQGFPHADTGIYNVNRLIRMTGSINGKSGLYKIPLTLSELRTLSIDEIKEAAKHERTIEAYPQNEIEPVPPLVALWKKHAVQEACAVDLPAPASDLLAPASHGERNSRAISICGYWIERGLKEADILSVLEMWNSRNAEPLPLLELQALVRGACKRYSLQEKDGAVEVYTLADAENEYMRIVDTPEHEKVRFGLAGLDDRIRAFTPGMVCSLVAKSSNGKSSFVQYILLKHARRSRRPVIFFSLEMPLSLNYERILQAETGCSGYKLEQRYIHERQSIRQRSAVIQTDLHNFFFCTKSGITVEDVAETVRAVERKTGEPVSLIAVDYLSLLGGKGRDVFERATVNAIALKQLAKNLAVPVIFLAQTTKSLTMYDTLDENAAKDAGSILEASDFQFVLWREKEDENDAEYNEWINFTLKLTKNRNGPQGKEIPVRMHKISLQWEERIADDAKSSRQK